MFKLTSLLPIVGLAFASPQSYPSGDYGYAPPSRTPTAAATPLPAPTGNVTSSNATWFNGHVAPTNCSAQMDDSLPSLVPSGYNYTGVIRRYYIAAEEVEWNFAPTGWDNWLGVPITASPRAKHDNILGSLGSTNGTTWLQALYRGYTDGTFTTLTEQPVTQGAQGPIIRAEVGDMIEIYFTNRLSNNYASIHSMGLQYTKENEGSLYMNTTDGSSPAFSVQEAVAPGGCAAYKWLIPYQSAPTKGNPVRLWSYHSFVNMPSETNAGLIGPVFIYATGQMARTMAQYRELPLLYNVYDQTKSFLAGANYARSDKTTAHNVSENVVAKTLNYEYAGNMSFWKPQLVNMPTVDLSSSEAPSIHALNGYIYSNAPSFEMCQDDEVVWGTYAFGAASHVFHLHGNNFNREGTWFASASLNDGNMDTLFMKAVSPGVWTLICHVNNHLTMGMIQSYTVYPKDDCPLPRLQPLSSGSTSG